jgi:hypothetical protein
MRLTICAFALCLSINFGKAEMVRNDAIGNDPAKEQLCIERAKTNKSLGPVKIVPFEIDRDYVSRSRSPKFGGNPDVVFIAVETAIGTSYLATCDINGGTGRYEPGFYTSENNLWHLIKPKQFQPGIDTPQGALIAVNRCMDAGVAKINRLNFDHSVSDHHVVQVQGKGKVRFPEGTLIEGVPAERYDVVVTGTALYKSIGPDMAAVDFTCLFSPVLEVKAIQIISTNKQP